MSDKRKNATWEEIQADIRQEIAEKKKEEQAFYDKYVDKVHKKLLEGKYNIDGEYVRVHIFAPELLKDDSSKLIYAFKMRNMPLWRVSSGMFWSAFWLQVYDWEGR